MSRTTRKTPPRLARPRPEDARGNSEPYRVAWEREYYNWLEGVEAHAEREAKRRAILIECLTELSLEVAHLILKLRTLGMTYQAAAPHVYEIIRHGAVQLADLDGGICADGATQYIIDESARLALAMSQNGTAN